MIALITGPVRSGKSSYALRLARESGKTITYVATAAVEPDDAEMRERVVRHQRERPGVRTIETGERPADLISVLRAASAHEVLVIDSLGTWVTVHLLALETVAERSPVEAERALQQACEPLFAALGECRADAYIVAEETGWGVVPVSVLGRIFRDVLGRLTMRLAHQADRAELVVAGFAIDLRAVGRSTLSDHSPSFT